MRAPKRKGLPDSPTRVRRPGLGGPTRPGWDEQEKATARAVPGGERVRGSGSSRRPSRKSDVVGNTWRVEDKTTGRPGGKTISVEVGWLLGIAHQARETGMLPAFTFGFDETPDRPRIDWMAFPMSDARVMMHAIEAVLAGNPDEALRWARMLGG